MPWWSWCLVAAAGLFALWVGAVGALVLAGRRTDARAVAGFTADCAVLVGRLLRDERVPRRRKLLLVALLVYLAFPFDVVPDFVPGVGQVDDVIAVALVLRLLVKGGGEALIREHWPGPERSLRLVLRAAGA